MAPVKKKNTKTKNAEGSSWFCESRWIIKRNDCLRGLRILWQDVVVCMFYHSLGFLTLCFGLIARDFNAVGYITLTKQGNKTGKYLYGQVFAVQKGLGTSVPARVRGGQA